MGDFRLIDEQGGRRRGWVETADHAQIYVETMGRGRPLVLVHGWGMSGRFWRRQWPLARERQVVVPDLRAHGFSTKVLHGHTLADYAFDLRHVVHALGLEDMTLVGWSLAGPLVLEYWRQTMGRGVAALGLVEMSPYPLGPPAWNTHHLAGMDLEGMNQGLIRLQADREAFGRAFIDGMFHSGQAPAEDMTWMLKEHLACPTPAAAAVYSDYLVRDLTDVLAGIDVPALALYGDSTHTCFGPQTGGYVARHIPGCRLEVFPASGHMPFYEEPQRFNQALADLP